MEIRRIGAHDAVAYQAFRLRALKEFPLAFTSDHDEEAGWAADAYTRRLGDADNAFWCAIDGGRWCGMVGLEREKRTKSRHKATVVGMFVAPDAAGRGVGRALVDALVAHARGRGIELLVLTVTVGNDTARRLYERAGFRSFGIEPRAIRVDGRFHGKNHMYLELHPL